MERSELFVPGRVCLFGEHSDWAGGYRRADPSIGVGYCLAVGTNQGICATISRHPDMLVVTSTLPDGTVMGPERMELDEKHLRQVAKAGGFFSYCAGVAYYALTKHGVGGLMIQNHTTDVPVRKGVSSSAAICVLTARAFNQAYNLGLEIRDEMELAYLGEILTPSECGRMDQACAYGSVPVFLTFDGDEMDIETLSPKSEIHLVVVDLMAGKDTKRILSDLNLCFPTGWGEIGKNVRWALGEGNREILLAAKQAIADGDAEAVGKLMVRAQEQFDRCVAPACPGELTAPVLHKALDFPPIQELIWGGKGVGSQGDGTAQFVAKGRDEQQEVIARLHKDLRMECFELTIQPVVATEGNRDGGNDRG